MRWRRASLAFVVALSAAPLAHGSDVAPSAGPQAGDVVAPSPFPALADAVADRATFTRFAAACQAALAPRDHGLGRVARACPGVDVVLSEGPFVDSLPENWAAAIDAEMLGQLRDLGRTFDVPAAPVRALRRQSLEAELGVLRGESRRRTTLWERLEAWYDDLVRRRSKDEEAPAWLERLMKQLGAENFGRWIEGTLYLLAVSFVIALLVVEARSRGWWSRLRALVAARRAADVPAAPAVAASPAADDGAELARRFGARLAELHAAGLLPFPLTITCRELARLAAANDAPALVAVARAAPVVEAARYAPRAPEPAALDAALALLATPVGASAT